VTDEQASDLTMRDVLIAAAEELPAIRRTDEDGILTFAAGATSFSALAGERAEFLLDPMVAGAALRTPNTEPSVRGSEWVAFEPATLDDAAVDRAEAWFLSAYRRAVKMAS